jgi:hypothetical protein
MDLAANNQVSLMNFGQIQGSSKKIAIRKKDEIIESIQKIEVMARKRHTENLK